MENHRSLSHKIGDQTGSGRSIAFIYGQSNTCGVYRDENGFVHIETLSAEPSAPEAAASKRYDELIAHAREFLPPKLLPSIRERLAFCLFAGMTSVDVVAALACFRLADRAINRAVALRTRLWYLGPATGLSGLIAAICLGLSYSAPTVVSSAVLGGALSGVGGAWTSLLQRISKLAPATGVESSLSYGLQGASRILLGGVFGLVAVAAVQANLILGIANGVPSAVTIVAFLAGFSERFVPELLRQVEEGALRNPQAPSD